MSSFTNPLVVKVEQKVKEPFSLYEEFSYDIGEKGSGETVRVPKGFKTDLASVPIAFRWLIPVYGPYGKPALVHDYLYWVKGNLWHGVKYSRKECDRIFLEAMGVMGVPLWKRYLVYAAVRLFGWWRWRKNNGGVLYGLAEADIHGND